MSNWDELLVTSDEVEAELIKNILDSEKIPFVINSLKIRPYPVNIGRMGEIKILVRKEDIEKAREVLKIMKNTSENGDL
jgi:hypothetical protein